ncbi:MAG: hypothetical protein NZ811_02655 [Gammaproteobacteria bacterium]|nr:hypothetical protein [Gammaproteobacteria bacterium]
MKPVIEGWRSFLLQERVSDIVWHYTPIHLFADILDDNHFMTSGAFTKPGSEGELGKGKLYYFSTARTPSISYGSFSSRYPNGVIIKLDGRKLSERYKAVPVDYYSSETWGSSKKSAKVGRAAGGGDDMFEAEDRIITDKPYIPDADTYMESVSIAIPLYEARTTDWKTGKYELEPLSKVRFSDYKYGKLIADDLEKRGIPYFIHVSPDTWKNVGISSTKAFDSWKAFENARENAGIPVEEDRTKGEYIPAEEKDEFGQDEVRIFTMAAAAILAGEEKFPIEQVQGETGWMKEKERQQKARQFFRTLAKRPDVAAQSIENSLHNISVKPKARGTLEDLASLMRSTKKKSIKDLADYLNQVYNKNHPEGEPDY